MNNSTSVTSPNFGAVFVNPKIEKRFSRQMMSDYQQIKNLLDNTKIFDLNYSDTGKDVFITSRRNVGFEEISFPSTMPGGKINVAKMSEGPDGCTYRVYQNGAPLHSAYPHANILAQITYLMDKMAKEIIKPRDIANYNQSNFYKAHAKALRLNPRESIFRFTPEENNTRIVDTGTDNSGVEFNTIKIKPKNSPETLTISKCDEMINGHNIYNIVSNYGDVNLLRPCNNIITAAQIANLMNKMAEVLGKNDTIVPSDNFYKFAAKAAK